MILPVENQGYKTSVKNPNKRKRAAHKRRVAKRNETERQNQVPILKSVENIPVEEEVRAIWTRPKIINQKIVKAKIKIVSFKKGHRNPPPVDGDFRDKLLCKACRKKYKNEFYQSCVNIKLAVVPDPKKVLPNEGLSYFPITDTYENK